MNHRAEPRARWRKITDRLKHNPSALKLADWLGRGRGRFRLFDRFVNFSPAPLKPDLTNWEQRTLSVVWLGHASLLIRMGGLTIYTDPVFSNRIGLGLGLITAGPQRLVGLPLPVDHLPKPDLILVSHAHFDHLDRPTLARLPRTADVITSQGNADLLADLRFRSLTQLEVGAATKVGRISVTAIPVQHWGARVFHDMHRGYCGFLLESGPHRLLFGADTAYQEGWKSLGPVDFAAVGIGAYNPWVASHATPEQAVAMADHCQARIIAPIHHSTFKLSHEPLSEPIARFKAAVTLERIAFAQIGGSWTAE